MRATRLTVERLENRAPGSGVAVIDREALGELDVSSGDSVAVEGRGLWFVPRRRDWTPADVDSGPAGGCGSCHAGPSRDRRGGPGASSGVR